VSGSVPCSPAPEASPRVSAEKASPNCSGRVFCRGPLMSRADYSPLPLPCLRRTVRAFTGYPATTPSADFYRPVRTDRSILSRDCTANGRSPEVSPTAFHTQPPDLQPVCLMNMDFVVVCPLVPHGMPHIWFLFIGSCVCSTLLSDPASRRRPCASLASSPSSGWAGTCTPKLSNMPRPQKNRPAFAGRSVACLCVEERLIVFIQ